MRRWEGEAEARVRPACGFGCDAYHCGAWHAVHEDDMSCSSVGIAMGSARGIANKTKHVSCPKSDIEGAQQQQTLRPPSVHPHDEQSDGPVETCNSQSRGDTNKQMTAQSNDKKNTMSMN